MVYKEFAGKNAHDDYLKWVVNNPDGFVINCQNKKEPTPDYLKLHRAGCNSINKLKKNTFCWTRVYKKICSNDMKELEEWARQNVPGYHGLQHCTMCNP